VCGLKWADISFTDATLSIRQTRVTVGGEIIEKGPKSRRGYRVLPLFEPVLGALEALYKAQVAEKAAAGAAWPGTVDGGYVACDELGTPVNPQTYSDMFTRLCAAAGLPKIRLHDCRHSTNSLLSTWASATAPGRAGLVTRSRST
jgi:integrase